MPPPGFTMIDNDVIERSSEVGSSAFQVYAAIARHADDQRRARPGIDRLAELTGLGCRWVRRSIRKLELAGWIVMDRKKGRVNVYMLPPMQSKEPQTPAPKISKEPQAPGVRNSRPLGKELQALGVRNSRPSEQDPLNKTQEQDPLNKTRGKVAVEIPAALEGEQFRAAWGRWTAHRRELRKPLTPSTIRAQLKKLTTWGTARAVAAIDRSVEAGWAGIFEPPKNSNGKPANNYADGSGQRYDPSHKSTVPIVGGF